MFRIEYEYQSFNVDVCCIPEQQCNFILAQNVGTGVTLSSQSYVSDVRYVDSNEAAVISRQEYEGGPSSEVFCCSHCILVHSDTGLISTALH